MQQMQWLMIGLLFAGAASVEAGVPPPSSTTTTTSTTTSTTTTSTVGPSTTTTVGPTTTTFFDPTTTTTTTTVPLCGNNAIDAGEACDPPNSEICNNLMDDDGDNLIDCADTSDCPVAVQTCGADCQFVAPCVPIEEDPAIISFDAGENGMDMLSIHGRFRPTTPIDPETEGLGFVITNANGTVYRGQLGSGVLLSTSPGKKRYRFRDRLASTIGGFAGVSVRARNHAGVPYITFRLKLYGDLSAATVARMTTQVVIGNEIASMTADWKARSFGWQLAPKDFQ